MIYYLLILVTVVNLSHYEINILFKNAVLRVVDQIHINDMSFSKNRKNHCQYMYLLTTQSSLYKSSFKSDQDYWIVFSITKPIYSFNNRVVELNQFLNLTSSFWGGQLLWGNRERLERSPSEKKTEQLKNSYSWVLVLDKRKYRNLMIAHIGMEFLIGFNHDLSIEMHDHVSERLMYSLHCRTGKVMSLTNPHYLLRTFGRY